MSIPNFLKQNLSQYNQVGLEENPFKLEPLFKDFTHKLSCEKEEALFVIPKSLENEVGILCRMKDRRALIYGCYGVGKTSFVDLILYLAYNFHRRFCVRVIITEDNVSKAINEFLLTLCFDIIANLRNKRLTQPIASIKKWFIERRYTDQLLASILKLLGEYEEEQSVKTVKRRKSSVNVSAAGVAGGEFGIDTEIEIRKGIKSYVEILPMKEVARYLDDFLHIIQEMGYDDLVIFIDEADYLSHIEVFIKMLTKAREVLFSKGYTFLIAGSPEIARYTESIGTIFDKIIFLKPASREEMEEILACRIQSLNNTLSTLNLFEKGALDLLADSSRGIRKSFLRLAENALDIAVMEKAIKISETHVLEAIGKTKDKIAFNLKDTQLKILQSLSNLREASPSDKNFQAGTSLSRVSLNGNLEKLYQAGYVKRERKGRKLFYSVAIPYKPYFLHRE